MSDKTERGVGMSLERVLMDWIDANGVELRGATPAMLVSVLRNAVLAAHPEPETTTEYEVRSVYGQLDYVVSRQVTEWKQVEE